MSLDFVQPEFFAYGFIMMLYTHDAFASIGFPWIVWTFLTWTAVHRLDTDEIQFEHHVWTFVSLVSGVWTAWAMVANLSGPRLFDLEQFPEKRGGIGRRHRFVVPLLFAFALVITAGVYYLLGNFSDVSSVTESESLAIGLPLTIGAGLAILGLVVFLLDGPDDKPIAEKFEDRQDVKYGLVAVFLVAVPAVLYDYLFLNDFDTFHGLVAIGALLVLYVLLYFYIGYFGFGSDGTNAFYRSYLGVRDASTYSIQKDRILDHAEALRIVLWSGSIQILSLLAAWLVDIATGDEIIPVVITNVALAVWWTLVLWIYARWWGYGQTERVGVQPAQLGLGQYQRSYAPVVAQGERERAALQAFYRPLQQQQPWRSGFS